MNLTPSYSEYTGLYNIRPEDYWTDPEDGKPDDLQILRTTADLPPLTPGEADMVRRATYACLERYGRRPRMDAATAKSFYRYCVGDELGDRTIEVALRDLRVLTPGLILHLQADVVALFPRWRLMILTAEPQNRIIVYPQVVRCGACPPDADLAKAILAIVTREQTLREPSEGPERRQMAYVTKLVPQLVRTLRSQSPRVVACFDNWRGNPNNISVWLLHRGASWDDEFTIIYPDHNGFAGCEMRAVRADGVFAVEPNRFDPEEAYAWLTSWILPAPCPPTFEIELAKADNPQRVIRRWTVRVEPRALIKDTDLLQGR